MKHIRQIGFGVLHQFQNGHKVLHLFLLIKRRAPLDQLVPDHDILEDLSGLLIRLGQAQRRPEVEECEEVPDHLGDQPELLLCLVLGWKHL